MSQVRRMKLMSRAALGIALASAIWSGTAHAECPPLPNTISNGQPADASKVMGDLNHLRDCLNGDAGTISTPSVTIESPAGPAVTINAPVVTSSYALSLPAGPGTAGQVLTSMGAGQQLVWAGSTGGGAAPVDGYPVSRPAVSSLSWLNQGNAVVTDHFNGPLSISIPSHTSYNLRGLQVSAPSGIFTTTAKLDCSVLATNSICGIHIVDSTGKIMMFGVANSGLTVATASNATSSFSNLKTVGIHAVPKWFRITRNNVNWIFLTSTNGADWVSIYETPLGYNIGATIASTGVIGTNYFYYADPISMTIPIWSLEVKSGAGTDSHW